MKKKELYEEILRRDEKRRVWMSRHDVRWVLARFGDIVFERTDGQNYRVANWMSTFLTDARGRAKARKKSEALKSERGDG